MTVALYARVSSDRQREEKTINSQLQELKNFAIRENLAINNNHIYTDDGESGYYLDRPGLDSLRDAARDGLIDLVLVYDPDRFSRKYAYQVLMLEEFKSHNVTVRFLNQPPEENPEKQLLLQMQGVIAEYERAKIIERTRRGRIYKIHQGIPISARVPYGYNYIPKKKNSPPSIEINESTARVVKEIFDLYVKENMNDRQIALYLREKNINSARKKLNYWCSSTIRFLLQNEAYTGTWYLNQYKKEARTGQRRPRVIKRPKKEWIPINIPEIIDLDTFNRAGEIRKSGVHKGFPSLRYPNTHLLRHLVYCGFCNKRMTAHNTIKRGYKYYWCRATDRIKFNEKVKWCPNPTIKAEELDTLVWNDIQTILTDPDLLLKAWEEQNGILKNSVLHDSESKNIKKKIGECKKQLKRLIDAYEAGVIELEDLKNRREFISEKKEKLEQKIKNNNALSENRFSIIDFKKNIKYICHFIKSEVKSMAMENRINLCKKLIDKVIVKKHDVEIIYKFPVSSNFNTKTKHQIIYSIRFYC